MPSSPSLPELNERSPCYQCHTRLAPGPTNEVLRQFVGKWALLGFESLDYWNQSVNERAMNNELKKLDDDAKRALIDRLSAELAEAEAAE